ncbi:zeaxanthin epoxidase [Fusarium subglutinans]|uniref:Zeaxanthin epoxidase chloroplastic n=1 Tax=Gibberella subglutinans TaxID=42677 RepID=A0A8H5P1M8_GIBSU|nr:zeaxanthin epoxidase [Fusarium subglutinans]KAF5583345.1 zeaxanthin epoxidase chloroplastic [Fusarium subglutinans]
MKGKSERTVIIAGGGISGLSLANMLERAGIRYVLLESHDEIAPQVGASIGLQSSGLRILDQLGCADELMSLVDIPLNNTYIRYPDGSVIKHHSSVQDHLIERHGYPTIFIDRQMLMQVLYNKLESKASVQPGQKVVSVLELDNGIQVTTDKGKVFEGDILVGADGIYSNVRMEMWRIASPGYFPADEWSRVPCYYKCIFGISRPLEDLIQGSHYVYNDKFSYLVLVGPGGKFYWFLFVKLPIPLYGRDIPRYTKVDEEELAAQHASDRITPEVTFGQLYGARTSSTLTPLHEYVFERWHYKRIITIGDAAHKFEPLTGHGGNSAIETAASLVNHLTSDECSDWSNVQIEAAFAAVQEERFRRVQWLVNDAHKTQQMQAMATPFLATIGPILARLSSTQTVLELGARKFIGATRISSIPVPQREHTIPFNDELPSQPLSWTWLPTGLGIIGQAAIFRLATQILRPLEIPTTFGGEPLVKHYTGLVTLDKILTHLVAVFGVPLASGNMAANLQWISFTPLLLSTTLDWTLESYRVGSKGLLTSFSSIFSTIYQIKAVGRIAPLYHLISVCESIFKGSVTPTTDRSIDKEVLESFVPGIALGYIMPTALMLWPFKNKATWQGFTALWQPFPVYVGLITAGFSTALRRQRIGNVVTRPRPKTSKEVSNRKRKAETQSLLRSVYAVGTAATALVHFYTLYRTASTPRLSFPGVFGSIRYLVSGASPSDPSDKIHVFLQRDMFLNAVSVLANSFYRTLDLRRLGYITSKEALTTSLAVLVAQPVLGPAATHIAFVGWREEMFMRIDRRISAYN